MRMRKWNAAATLVMGFGLFGVSLVGCGGQQDGEQNQQGQEQIQGPSEEQMDQAQEQAEQAGEQAEDAAGQAQDQMPSPPNGSGG